MGTMNGDTMTFPALTLPITAPMTDNVLKQRAAQKLATDWKPVHEFLPRLEGSIGCSRRGTANPGSQRQHQPRDRFGLRNGCARASRCASCRPRCFFRQPTHPIGQPGSTQRHRCNISSSRQCRSWWTDELWTESDRCVSAGAKLADLPVVQSSKFELVINRIASSEIMLTNQYCAPRSALA